MDEHTEDSPGVSSAGERDVPAVGDADPTVSDDAITVTEALPDVPCEFTCGVAGSGKTYYWRERISANPADGILAATTGIAAVNLGTVTLNSLLRYFDTASLRDGYLNGMLVRILRDLRDTHRRIVIDEVSMMDGEQLSLLVRGTIEANSYLSTKNAPPLGLTLVGDFAQLPPVKAKWAFESDEWHRFEATTTRLTKVWRQEQGEFLNALNFCRSGNGAVSADILTSEGLQWHNSLDVQFDGTTIVTKNDAVDRYNTLSLDRLPGSRFHMTNCSWGKQSAEAKLVPATVTLKPNAYVMLLANAYDTDTKKLIYANGDCGHVVEPSHSGYLTVRLVRTGDEVSVDKVIRAVGGKHKPEGWARTNGGIGRGEWLPRPHWNPFKQQYVEGQIAYWPVRLAYASTVYKSQGLSLDRLQVDLRDHFFTAPAMEYVAMSRCRTLEGLRLVGQPERYVRNCKIDPRVARWL